MFNKRSAWENNYGKLDIVLCESRKDVADNIPFRLVTDAENVVRIKQQYSIATDSRCTFIVQDWELPVAGVSYRSDEVMRFIAGKPRSIQLVQEQTEKYPHAIAVYGMWQGSIGMNHKEQLGYIPNDDAKEISKYLRRTLDSALVGKLTAMFIPHRNKEAGLRIDVAIMTPPPPKFEIHGFGRENKRKRKRTYWAKDLDEAIKKASKDGIIVDVRACKQIH